MKKSLSFTLLEQQLAKNILLLDGAMGTMIPKHISLKNKIFAVNALLIGTLT